jgi:pseudouridine kinase
VELSIPNKNKPVLVIGAAGIDLVGRLKGDLRPGTSNPGQILSSFGGVARNVAENLARLGQAVSLITAVGQDEEGQRLVQNLEQAGVDTQWIVRSEDQSTGAYLAVINPSGVLQFALDDMRAVAAVTPEYIRRIEAAFFDASLIFLDANLPKETLRTVFSLARRARLPVCADPASASLSEKLKPYLSRLFLITPNSGEAEILCSPAIKITNRRQALAAAKCLVGLGVGIAIITLAEQGLCYASSEVSGYIQAIRTSIVDPTGAGDALTSAVIFALLNEIPLDDAVRLGVSAASLTLQTRGAVVPDLTLEKLYDRLVI